VLYSFQTARNFLNNFVYTYTVGAAGITATEFGGSIPMSMRRRVAYSVRGIPSITGPPPTVANGEEEDEDAGKREGGKVLELVVGDWSNSPA